ncbi:MAG TPA: endonuclease/exonuclease/phosphatase family protein [Solimonas sp.]|nr:endonuclease/exonuclease/phosphatase family protein [Solimonas sp.]
MSAASPTSKAPSTVSLKIMTLNTHKGFTSFNRKFILHELRDAVRTVSADIVFLQEVLGAHGGHSARHGNWPAAPQYEFLADSIWPGVAYGRNAVYEHGHHGNAVLSKFPIVRQENHDISISGPERRGLLHCVLKIPQSGVEIHAICVHLGLLGSHRRHQLEILCRLLADVPPEAPLVIAGDFNDWQVHANRILERCGVSEAFVGVHGRPPRTFPARWPLLPLDRVYCRNLKVERADVLRMRPWSHLSDHAALTAEFAL